jgi:hypothetical protein
MASVIGYKAFDNELKGYGGFQFEVGKTYVHNGPESIELCKVGFHFCLYPQDVLSVAPKIYRFAIIEASGEVIHGFDKSVCSSIRIVEEISKEELCKRLYGYIKRSNGSEEWYKDGLMHRDNDLPAMMTATANIWYKNGEIHRDDDKPAIEYTDGGMMWYKEGLQHRDGDMPAVIIDNLIKMWYVNGLKHRDGDMPAEILPNGTKYWYKEGLEHRDGGLPSTEFYNGSKEWWVMGEFIKSEKCGIN